MDKILNGILRSDKSNSVKKAVVEKVKKAGATPQSIKAIKDVIQLTMELMLSESDPFAVQSAKEVYLAWAENNCSMVPDFFTKKTVHSLMEEAFDHPENVPWLFHNTFNIMNPSHGAIMADYYLVVQMRAIDFVRRNSHYPVMHSFCHLLLAFKDCIPRAQFTIPFCDALILNISKFDVFFGGRHAISIIRNINGEIAGLLRHIWEFSGEEVIHASLKTIFQILSSNKAQGKDPILCLGGIVKHIPPQFIEPSAKLLTSDRTISDEELTLTMKRVIGWLSWPGADTAVDWMKALFLELRSVGKHDIVKWAIETNIDNVCETMTFGVVRWNNFRALQCMLFSVQDSPDPWLKIAPSLPNKIEVIREDLKNSKTPPSATPNILIKLAELVYCMAQLFPGFPDIYESLFNAIQDLPRPTPQAIEQILQIHGYHIASKSRDRLRSSSHAQVYIQKSKSGKIGLGNLGNTCYMNSVLQAIYMCDSFRRDVLASTPSGSQLLLVKLQYVFAFLTASHRPFYCPDAFHDASRPTWFEKGCQQDSSEFLRHLLDQLDSQELANLRGSMKKSKSSSTLKKDKKEHSFSLFKSKTKETKSPPENLSLCIEENASLVSRTFGGQFLNTYQCLKCNTESTRVEKFNDIALAFPESLQHEPIRRSKRQHVKQRLVGGNHDTGGHVTSVNVNNEPESSLTLDEMLENFLAPETLTGDNKYKCDKCKSLQEAERRIHITHGPEYLVLTLLRFSFDLKTHRRTKIFTDVKYPKTLHVPVTECSTPSTPDGSYTDKKKSRRKSPTSSMDTGSEGSSSLNKTLVYGLCGVVVHSGLSSDAGHYYCYARHSIPVDQPSAPYPGQHPDYLQEKWYLFNDSRVTYSSYESFSEVTQKFSRDTAYQLFYKKVDIGSAVETVSLNSTIVPQIVDPPLRIDLLNAVDKDNERFIQEQEREERRQEAEKSRQGFALWGWRDNHDRGPPPPSCGGGGGGSMGFSSPNFIC